VVACRNRNLKLPEKLEEAHENITGTGTRTSSVEVISQTKSLK
jgi:hypothetical protein